MSRAGTSAYVISGFLGSGKTTFLNHMLKEVPPDLKLLVLMNEFGEESIDGTLVEDPELEMVEISRGSIFCACVKGDFIKALCRVAFVIQPDVLVIEASGVANPADIGRDLFNPVFKGRYTHLEKVCIIDAANFMEQYEIFTAVEKQIEASDSFIINKTDLVQDSTVDSVKEVILGHNPGATFMETSFARVVLPDLFSFVPQTDAVDSEITDYGTRRLTEDALEAVVDRILDDESAQVAPPDRLISIACRWLSGSLKDFRGIAEKLPSDVIRAKGFVFENGRPYLYSHVGHSYDIVPFEGPRLLNRSVNRVVFIRRELKEDDIRSMFADRGLRLV
ncbi:MAG TPA: CobW family GTP-binding protein [Desulfomonilaceae bacterium]|nr:CobW family GTP-binding protein [Desulfomonilaceae bacterium]